MYRSKTLATVRLLPLACAAMVCCADAAAALSDTIHPFIALGYTYDDNLLRLPDDYPFITQRSDRATQAQAGFTVDRPFGRQKLTGSAKVSRVTFDHFKQLDYNGKDFNADLAWELGNRWSGHLGGNYTETLTPFNDLLTDQRNLRTMRREYGSAAWRFHPSWQLRGSYTQTKYDYELAVQRLNNRDEKLAEFGADYLARSGSKIGLVYRQWKGEYENPFTAGGVLVNDDFKQDELKANISWLVSGMTQVQVLAGYAKRKHTVYTMRDSSGLNGRASVKWAPLRKVSFTAETWREFAAVESFRVTNSLNRGTSIGTTWNATAKIQATASYKQEKRRFELIQGTVGGADGSDKLRSTQIGLVYAPTQSTQISLTGFSEKRDGSVLAGTNDYRAKGVSLNASAQF